MKKRAKAEAALIIAAVLWGAEFVVTKDIIEFIPANWTNVVRFAVSAVIALFLWRREFAAATRDDWKKGLVSGIIMGLGFAFQIIGLNSIEAGENAFLSSVYVIVIPFILWVIMRTRPPMITWLCVLIAMTGILLVSATGHSLAQIHMGFGEVMTIIGAVCYAGGIVATDFFAKEVDEKLLAGIQFIAALAVSLAFALLFEKPPSVFSLKIGLEFIYIVLLGGFVPHILFTFGMKYTPSTRASMIFLLESVVALFAGMIFLSEKVYFINFVGCALIILSIVLQNLFGEKQN